MKTKAVNVEPFVETYRVYDKFDDVIVIESDSIYKLYLFVMERSPYRSYGAKRISYTMKKEIGELVWKFDYAARGRTFIRHDPPRYVIVDRFNVAVPESTVDAVRKANYNSRRRANREDFRANLVKTKTSNASIKRAYRTVPNMWWGSYIDEPSIYYTFAELHHYRSPSTMREMRKACADMDDYGDNIVRAKRNHKNLPNSYDDVYCGVYGTRKSWKHNSKRRKQWKPKTEAECNNIRP